MNIRFSISCVSRWGEKKRWREGDWGATGRSFIEMEKLEGWKLTKNIGVRKNDVGRMHTGALNYLNLRRSGGLLTPPHATAPLLASGSHHGW
jgi:hypothetical protein